MRLTDAFICLDCQWVFDSTEYTTCPRCCNKWTLRLSKVLNREPEKAQDGKVVLMKKRRMGV